MSNIKRTLQFGHIAIWSCLEINTKAILRHSHLLAIGHCDCLHAGQHSKPLIS